MPAAFQSGALERCSHKGIHTRTPNDCHTTQSAHNQLTTACNCCCEELWAVCHQVGSHEGTVGVTTHTDTRRICHAA